MSSLIVKVDSSSTNKNIFNLPINVSDDNLELTAYSYITSYKQLEEDYAVNQVLTTDVLTDDYTDTTDNKVLSCEGFSVFKNQILDIVNDSMNNQVAYIDYYSTTATLANTYLHNCMALMGEGEDDYNSNYFGWDDDLFDTVDTATLFDVANHYTAGEGEFVFLKILLNGVYRINYNLTINVANDTTEEATVTPIIKIIRGESNGDTPAHLIHHNRVYDDTLDVGSEDPRTQAQNMSYLVNDETAQTFSFTGAEKYIFTQSGSTTFTYNGTIDEYIGIFCGATLTINPAPGSATMTLEDFESDDKHFHFTANIEFLGTV